MLYEANFRFSVGVVLAALWMGSAVLGTTGAPSTDDLANMTYLGVYEKPVRLSSGRFLGKPFTPGGASRPRVELVPGFRLTGDVDGDDRDEAVALLAESSGGSGTNHYVAVVGHRDGQPTNLATALLGDRVQIRAARIEAGQILFDIVRVGPKDAMCCPSEKASSRWAIREGRLVEVASEATGKVSLADLEGTEWVLRKLARNERVPALSEITIEVEGEKLTGGGGCNRYFGRVTAGDTPGDLSIEDIGATRMACSEQAMSLEARYLAALAKTVKFSFIAGQLALTTIGEDGVRTMIFAPR